MIFKKIFKLHDRICLSPCDSERFTD